MKRCLYDDNVDPVNDINRATVSRIEKEDFYTQTTERDLGIHHSMPTLKRKFIVRGGHMCSSINFLNFCYVDFSVIFSQRFFLCPLFPPGALPRAGNRYVY